MDNDPTKYNRKNRIHENIHFKKIYFPNCPFMLGYNGTQFYSKFIWLE